jgi:hypothetical protein
MFLKMTNAHTHTNSLTHRDSNALGAPEWLRYTACIAGYAQVHSTRVYSRRWRRQVVAGEEEEIGGVAAVFAVFI